MRKSNTLLIKMKVFLLFYNKIIITPKKITAKQKRKEDPKMI